MIIDFLSFLFFFASLSLPVSLSLSLSLSFSRSLVFPLSLFLSLSLSLSLSLGISLSLSLSLSLLWSLFSHAFLLCCFFVLLCLSDLLFVWCSSGFFVPRLSRFPCFAGSAFFSLWFHRCAMMGTFSFLSAGSDENPQKSLSMITNFGYIAITFASFFLALFTLLCLYTFWSS